MQGYHKSVLLKEVINELKVAEGKWYLDVTLGDGGHSVEILRRGGKVFGVDVDPQALQRVQKRLQELGIGESRFKLVQGNFREVKNLIKPAYAKDSAFSSAEPASGQRGTVNLKFKGVLFDLGVSSLQLESPGRGFSFSKEGSLDMRLDPSLGVRALDLLNVLSSKELYEVFSKFGEEKYSKRIADALVLAREVRGGGGIKTTKELAEFIERIAGGRAGKIHPATRVFQALRIAVNDELNALKEGLGQVIDLIEKDGHILVISFHSLEDRIVKNTFRNWQLEGLGQVLTKKPVIPSEEEVRDNPRSRSAKLRAFELEGMN